MKLYADLPMRRLGQASADVLVLILMYLSVQLGQTAHDAVAALARPGAEAERQALRLGDTMRSAARETDDAPLVGDELAAPFRALAGTSRDLASSAQDYQNTVADLASLTGLVVAGVPILVLLLLWLPRRLRWVIEASAADRLLHKGHGATELLAIRALARQPLPTLARLGPDVVSGWKSGDRAATERLARLEAADLGLRLPAS